MDESPLARLPAELRLSIYEYALANPDPVKLCYRFDQSATIKLKLCLSTFSSLKGITQTCRLIRHECDKLFYSHNTFIIHVLDFYDLRKVSRTQQPISMLEHAVHRIGAENAAVIPGMTLDLGDFRVSTSLLTRDTSHVATSRKGDPAIVKEVFDDLREHAQSFPCCRLRLIVGLGMAKAPYHGRMDFFLIELDMGSALDGIRDARNEFVIDLSDGKWEDYWPDTYTVRDVLDD